MSEDSDFTWVTGGEQGYRCDGIVSQAGGFADVYKVLSPSHMG